MTAARAGEKAALQLMVFTGETHTFEDGSGTFSPTTSTLIMGARDIVLVDAQHITTDVAKLGDLIESTGRRLRTIFVTHGHADHWYGIQSLSQRFPGVQAVATRGVVDWIKASRERAQQQWKRMFGARAVEANIIPDPLESSINLEGHTLNIVELGQGDIAPSTALHAPGLDAVVPGDVVYNKIHMMLGLTSSSEWQNWLSSIDIIERLSPKVLIAGHKQPNSSDRDVARILRDSRSYIQTFAKEAPRAESADHLIQAMRARFPDFGNLWTLEFSAKQYFSGR
jgi:glyoxylase-like metal-dependent hydrolase (beta-lactamase superfamily II)